MSGSTHRHRRHSRLRRLRRRLRFTRLQVIVAFVMLLAAAGGSAAVVLLLHGPAPLPSYSAVAPPLALGPNGLKPVQERAQTVPLTVRLIIPSVKIDLPV